MRPNPRLRPMAKGTKPRGAGKPQRKELVRNRKARYEYEILERKEAGLVLRGTEVKSLRAGNASLAESFVRFDGEEAFWVNGTIDEYPWGNVQNHDPKRKRKLLLRRSELRRMRANVRERGHTVIPLAIYLNERGILKMEIGLARGRKRHDKREAQKKKQAAKDVRRELDG